MRVTKQAIDKALRAAGFDGEVLKGQGYIYFASPTVTFQNSMVMTIRFSDLPVESWLDEYRAKLEESYR